MQRQFNRRVLIGIPLVVSVALFAGICASSAVRYPVSRYHLAGLADLYLPLPKDTQFFRVKVSPAWASEPWTGDDAPYQRIEKKTDAALASRQFIGNLLAESSSLAQQNPTDPQAQFQWSYMARQVILAQPPSRDWWDATEAIAVVLARAQSPKTYSYARLRFLETGQAPDLTDLGERLLQRDANDAPVKDRLSEDYTALFSRKSQQTHAVDPQLKQRALSLANQLIAAHPLNAKFQRSLAAVYVSSWADHANPEDAAKAVAAYQEYLRLAPPDDSFHLQCKAIVAGLQKYLAANPVRPK